MTINIKRSVGAIRTHYTLKSLATAFVLFWLPMIVFLKLAGEVLENEPLLFDSSILHFVHSYASNLNDSIFLWITNSGSAMVIAPLTIALIGLLLYRQKTTNALLLFFGVGGAAAANVVLKLLFHRDRPTFWQSIITERSYSFPSGHAMASCALALCIVIITWNSPYRWLVRIAAAGFIILVGLSRIYFGVHYPTDIIAGWMVSALWVLIVSSCISNQPFNLKKG